MICGIVVKTVILFSLMGLFDYHLENMDNKEIHPVTGAHMKKQLLTLLLAFFLIGLWSCAKNEPKPAAADQNNTSQIRRDAEGLVELRIENGAASLTYNLGKWEELHRIRAFAAERFPDLKLSGGPFPVEGLSGRVKDACIAKVGDLDYLKYSDAEDFSTYGNLVMPAVIFLMEDGGVEWGLADVLNYSGAVYIDGRLPFIRDIVSLSYEPDRGGIKSRDTIYATDKNGLRYDMKLLCGLTAFFETGWRSEWPGRNDEEFNFSNLLFTEDGSVVFTLGLQDEYTDWNYAGYFGIFEIFLAENDPGGKKGGTITFDLSLDFTNRDKCPVTNRGTYLISGDSGWALTLWLESGDPLLDGYGNPVERYLFYPSDHFIGGYGPAGNYDFTHDLAGYLLDKVEKAHAFVHGLGMSTLVTGETEELRGSGDCILVFLGSEDDDQFVKEIQYAISGDGVIFEYDPIFDLWDCVFLP